MQANYVAKKSAWSAVRLGRVLLIWLIIPIFIIIFDIIRLKNETIEFYDERIVTRKGVLSKKVKKTIFTGVVSVSVNQSLFGRIFNYGNVEVDVMGEWDVNTKGIANPHKLEEYLETKIINKNAFANVVTNGHFLPKSPPTRSAFIYARLNIRQNSSIENAGNASSGVYRIDRNTHATPHDKNRARSSFFERL